jgi:CelD/BcsL family acetyltransferase involved in cellulose biosynthesis
MLDVNLLKIDNKPVAFLYGYHHRGNVIALRTGFDATAGDGLGSALMLEMIDNSCQRGDRVVDFGPGEREHKRRLRTRQEPTYRITYMPVDSWRSQAVRLTRWAKEHLRRRPATVAAS